MQAAENEANYQLLEEQQELTAWSRYENQWRLFKRLSSIVPGVNEVFHFEDIPWPTAIPPTSPSSITPEEVARFLFSGPLLDEGMTLKSRIKDCLLRWHPDKFSGRWMQYVVESDKSRVRDGIDAVIRAGNKVMADYSSHKPNLAQMRRRHGQKILPTE
ncbi:hypothetical protein FRC12_003816 [Ceratobasidium sp. 428]|nr:hypothetical protein FRC12_003816 [Ceratobasidium sp. 428]